MTCGYLLSVIPSLCPQKVFNSGTSKLFQSIIQKTTWQTCNSALLVGAQHTGLCSSHSNASRSRLFPIRNAKGWWNQSQTPELRKKNTLASISVHWTSGGLRIDKRIELSRCKVLTYWGQNSQKNSNSWPAMSSPCPFPGLLEDSENKIAKPDLIPWFCPQVFSSSTTSFPSNWWPCASLKTLVTLDQLPLTLLLIRCGGTCNLNQCKRGSVRQEMSSGRQQTIHQPVPLEANT